MVEGAIKPKKRKKRKTKKVIADTSKKRVTKRVIKRVIKKKRKISAPLELESFPKRKKVANPAEHDIDDEEVQDINSPISFDISANIPSTEDIANFGADKRRGFNVEDMLNEAQKSMGSIFESLTNDSKTFGSKMDSIFQLQMLSLLPIIQNLDDTMYDERKALAAVKLNDTITHLKNSLVQKQQFELKEEIDLHHPKIQKAFSFLTEAFFYVLTEVGVDPSVKALVVNALSLKMMGFEEELTKRFKGVAFSLLEQVENPLLEGLPNVKQLEIAQANLMEQRKKEVNKEDDFDENDDSDKENIIDIIPDRK